MAQCWRICLPVQETRAQSLIQEDPLEEETATHSSILAWERKYSCLLSHGQRSLVGYSPWGRKRVRHDCGTKQQRQGIKRGHLSQFWLRHQRLTQLIPRIPTTRSWGSGQVTSAGQLPRWNLLLYHWKSSTPTSKEVGSEGLRELFIRGRVGVPYIHMSTPVYLGVWGASQGRFRELAWHPLCHCEFRNPKCCVRIPSGNRKG